MKNYKKKLLIKIKMNKNKINLNIRKKIKKLNKMSKIKLIYLLAYTNRNLKLNPFTNLNNNT